MHNIIGVGLEELRHLRTTQVPIQNLQVTDGRYIEDNARDLTKRINFRDPNFDGIRYLELG